MRELYITNSLSRQKEIFKPINEGHVGLYVCGPTVYGDAHLGHARPGVTYDVFVKLLKHLGYKVRYVRNTIQYLTLHLLVESTIFFNKIGNIAVA